MDVAVVQLGVGNTASVMFALERLGVRAVLTNDPGVVADAPRLILPGVGAAAHAMRQLESRGLAAPLRAFARPLLGICLGQQLLYERSEEGDVAALSRMPGAVTALPSSIDLPTPHMGWSDVQIDRTHPLLDGVRSGAYFYFVHAFACPIGDATLATARYGRAFAAVSAAGNALGVQFHPERSGAVGARVLANFLALPC